MDYQTDIVVLSDIPKELDGDIEVVVGLPSKNPWSLPFGHKRVFSERENDYELFIYSEDDVLITQKNIDAFLKVTKILPENEIAGFMRFEVDPTGMKYYSTIHSHFHWLPNSVKSFGEFTFARFTNDHSGCYILTKIQLKKALSCNRFHLGPRYGYYGMPETAATDIYTQCKLKKVICISHLDDFMLPHMPNKYIGEIGISKSEVELQIAALMEINKGILPAKQLFNPETNLTHPLWNKSFYELCQNEILEIIPEVVKKVLSVGCGWGATEYGIIQKGMEVVGIPLDSVIGACAKAKGVRITYPDFSVARNGLGEEKFDCLLFSGILHHLPDPLAVLSLFSELLKSNGYVVISAPNFNHISVWAKRFFGDPIFRDFKYIGDFKKSRLHLSTHKTVSNWMKQSGIEPIDFIKSELHLTTTRREEKWFLHGGLKYISKIRASFTRHALVTRIFLPLINSTFGSKIVLLGRKI